MVDKIHTIKLKKSILLEKLVSFEGGHLSYEDFFFWPVFWELEDLLDRDRRIGIARYMLGGRQISKSTSLAGECTIGLHEVYNRMLYIAPQSSQTKVFSTQRLNDMLESPMVHTNLFTKKSKLLTSEQRGIKLKVNDDVFTKRTVLGSYLNLTYTDGTDTGRIRGYSADTALGDECQSMTDLVAVHHVARYCLRSSRRPRFLNVGTSFGDDDFSKASEEGMFFVYHVKCDGCNREQDLRELSNIDIVRRAVVCRYCGKPLDVVDLGRFIITNPEAQNLSMHTNMLMLPSLRDVNNGSWAVIESVVRDPHKSDSQKKEELLGVPGLGGEGLITRGVLHACPRVHGVESLQDAIKALPTYGDGLIVGIDWGGDSDPEQPRQPEDFINSHTAISVTGIRVNPTKGRTIQSLLWAKTYPVEDPNASLSDIFQILKVVAPRLVGVATDFGGGFFPNPKITDFLSRVIPGVHFCKVQLLPMLSSSYEFSDNYTLKVHKAAMMTEYFRKIKSLEVEIAGHDDRLHGDFYTGALSQRLYVEKSGRRFWKKKGKESDDVFMASLFAYLLGIHLTECTHEVLKNVQKIK